MTSLLSLWEASERLKPATGSKKDPPFKFEVIRLFKQLAEKRAEVEAEWDLDKREALIENLPTVEFKFEGSLGVFKFIMGLSKHIPTLKDLKYFKSEWIPS
mmetsp:Transcript_15539/g.23840  ORF Transcript_15539/g.23840 Transcript_15539/m.23840 type:complete len:101 (-) Transcript_15539:126-428(-)